MKRFILGLACLLLVFFTAYTDAKGNDEKPKTPTSEKSTQTDLGNRFSFLLNGEPIDYLRSGALILAFLATAFAGPETWLQVDTIGSLVAGAGIFFFPETLLAYTTKAPLDDIHHLCGQLIGALLIGTGVLSYRANKSSDPLVSFSLLLSRVLSMVVLFQTEIFSYMQKDSSFKIQHQTFTTLAVGLFLGGGVINLLKFEQMGGGTARPSSRLGWHIMIDLIVMICSVFCIVSHPDQMITDSFGEGDNLHSHLYIVAACISLQYVFYALMSLGFRFEEDRKDYVTSRLLCLAFCWTVGILNHFKGTAIPQHLVRNSAIINALIVLNLSAAYFCKRK